MQISLFEILGLIVGLIVVYKILLSVWEWMMNKYIVMSVLWIALASVTIFSIINTKGSPCAVEISYANSKATYVGYSL